MIATALAAKAALLVTGDRLLLSMGACQGVKTVDAGEALRQIAEKK